MDLDTERAARLRANSAKLAELGLFSAKEQAVKAALAVPARPRAAPRPAKQKAPPTEVRRSTRERAQVSYNEEEAFKELMPSRRAGAGGSGARSTRDINHLQLTEEQVEALRAKRARSPRAAGSEEGSEEGDEDEEGRPSKRRGPRGPRDSGKGVRKQGGKLYDSATGVTCHWCRQKTVDRKVTCTHPACGRTRMPYSFCERCLWNRHGEDVVAAEASGSWVCPPCRGSCGRGCVVCCNCGPCRTKMDLPPTGQVKKHVKELGYTNAHDWLVGKITSEDQTELTDRKLRMPWAEWMTQPQQKASGKQQQEEEDEEERDDEDEEEQQEEEEPEDKEQEVALKQAAKPRAAGKAAEGAAKRRRHAAAMAAVAAAIGELDSSDEGKQEEQMELEGEEEREQEEEQEQTGQSKSQPGRTERGGGKTAGVEKATVPSGKAKPAAARGRGRRAVEA
ncbi:hypothetical protein CHLRE_12g531350v5 [Chlamydomonas reinhardtii]|uniref:Zinc-finger domain-containing protein n=1 Tax=Chlamydomonas reinhardtii TaxID=3055 RepID=A0A2K3D4T7_CHLRE|nr:uncharacterized protein CHLRE_12g531350v5 [Chlamydomonas reinhardtii]PNW75556.1 hypothetical protein CHLRE_12g531350v5 [Chlamydomonas reinhardtii]